MKRIVLLALSVFLLGNMNAQENENMPKRPKPHHVTYEQMTGKMVKQLQLDEKQQKKIAKLNKKYKTLIEGEKMEFPQGQRPPMGQRPSGRPRGGMGGPSGGPGGFGGGMPGGGPGGFGGGMPGGGPRGGMGMPGGPSQEKAYDYDKQQQKYDKAIGKLLSEKQFEEYKKMKPEFASQRRVREFLFGDQQGERPVPPRE